MGIRADKIRDIEKELKKFSVSQASDNIKVSVIVPTYNDELYLPRCLFSLVKQTLKDIEIIVVNDGSTDDTACILDLFVKYDKRFKIINQSNLKQGIARNRGMENALGEYIGYVDSDDWIDLDYFEKLYNSAKKYDADIALATNIRTGNGKTKKRLHIENEVLVSTLQGKIDISNQSKNPCPTNKIYRRKMLLENLITWPEGVYCEDKIYTIKALYYANSLVAVPSVFYYYFRNPNSTVNNKNVQRRAKAKIDKINANRAVLNFLKEKNADIRDKEFWALKTEKKLLGITLYKIFESIKTEKILLFGFIPFVRRSNEIV